MGMSTRVLIIRMSWSIEYGLSTEVMRMGMSTHGVLDMWIPTEVSSMGISFGVLSMEDILECRVCGCLLHYVLV